MTPVNGDAFVLVRFERDGTGYRLANPITFPPSFDGTCWVKAFVGITDHEVWIDIAKAYLFEEHKARAEGYAAWGMVGRDPIGRFDDD